MAKQQSSTQILTGYRLADGMVVFLDAAGGWTEALAEARIATAPEQAAELERLGAAAKAANVVIDPYLVDVTEEGGTLHPVRLRERLRLWGPTVGHSLGFAAGAEPRAVCQAR